MAQATLMPSEPTIGDMPTQPLIFPSLYMLFRGIKTNSRLCFLLLFVLLSHIRPPASLVMSGRTRHSQVTLISTKCAMIIVSTFHALVSIFNVFVLSHAREYQSTKSRHTTDFDFFRIPCLLSEDALVPQVRMDSEIRFCLDLTS